MARIYSTSSIQSAQSLAAYTDQAGIEPGQSGWLNATVFSPQADKRTGGIVVYAMGQDYLSQAFAPEILDDDPAGVDSDGTVIGNEYHGALIEAYNRGCVVVVPNWPGTAKLDGSVLKPHRFHGVPTETQWDNNDTENGEVSVSCRRLLMEVIVMARGLSMGHEIPTAIAGDAASDFAGTDPERVSVYGKNAGALEALMVGLSGDAVIQTNESGSEAAHSKPNYVFAVGATVFDFVEDQLSDSWNAQRFPIDEVYSDVKSKQSSSTFFGSAGADSVYVNGVSWREHQPANRASWYFWLASLAQVECDFQLYYDSGIPDNGALNFEFDETSGSRVQPTINNSGFVPNSVDGNSDTSAWHGGFFYSVAEKFASVLSSTNAHTRVAWSVLQSAYDQTAAWATKALAGTDGVQEPSAFHANHTSSVAQQALIGQQIAESGGVPSEGKATSVLIVQDSGAWVTGEVVHDSYLQFNGTYFEVSVSGLPSTMSFDSETLQITGTLPANQESVNLSVTGTHMDGTALLLAASALISIAAVPVNPPTFQGLPSVGFRQGSNMPIPGERKGSRFFADLVQYGSAWRFVNSSGQLVSGSDGLAPLKPDGFPDFASLSGDNVSFGMSIDQPEAGALYGSFLDSGTYQIQHANAPANSVRLLTPGDAAGAGYMGGTIDSTTLTETIQQVSRVSGSRLAIVLLSDGCDDLHLYFDGEEPGPNPTQFRPRELALTDSYLTPGTGHIRHMQTAGVYTEDLGTFEAGGPGNLIAFGWSIPAVLPSGSPYHKDRANDIRAWTDDTELLGKSGWAIEDIVDHANAMAQPLFISLPIGYGLPQNQDALDSTLQYINDNILVHATVELGSEDWNGQFTPFAIINRERGGLTRGQYLAGRYDHLIQRCRLIDPGISKLKIYVGGQTGFQNFLGSVLSNMNAVCQSAGTAPYSSPSSDDLAAWNAAFQLDGTLPTPEAVIDSCISELPRLQSALQPHVDAIAAYEARLGVTVERIAYEGGYAFYSPAAFRSVTRQVLLNPSDKLKDLYRQMAQIMDALGYDEVIWYNLVGRLLVGSNDSVFGHGETLSRELLTDPTGGAGTQTVADQHQPKAQITREWLPQFQLVPEYDLDGGAASFDVSIGASVNIDPVSGVDPFTGDSVADIDHPWDRIFIDPGSPALPSGVSFQSDEDLTNVGRFTIDGGASPSSPESWTGNVLMESDLSGNISSVQVTLNFVSSDGPSNPGFNPGDGTVTNPNGAPFQVALTIEGDTTGMDIALGAGAPAWASITHALGSLSGTLTLSPPVDGASGVASIPIEYTNAQAGPVAVSYGFTRQLNAPSAPTFNPTSGTELINAGDMILVSVAAMGAGVISLDLGPSAPAGASILDNGDGTAALSFAPSIDFTLGPVLIPVIASNLDGSSQSDFSVTVTAAAVTEIVFDAPSSTVSVMDGGAAFVFAYPNFPGDVGLYAVSNGPTWVTVNVPGSTATAAALVIMPPAATAPGIYSFDVFLANAEGGVTRTYSVEVSATEEPPTDLSFSLPSGLKIANGAGRQLVVSANASGVTYSDDGTWPAWASVAVNGVLIVSPPFDGVFGLVSLPVEGSNNQGTWTEAWVLERVNTTPDDLAFTPDPGVVGQGETATVAVSATISAQATVAASFELRNGPDWMSISQDGGVGSGSTATITLTPPADELVNAYTVDVVAIGEDGLTEKVETFTVNLSAQTSPPTTITFTPQGSSVIQNGTSLAVDFAVDGSPFSAVSLVAPDAWVGSLVDNGDGTGAFVITPPVDGVVGPDTVTLHADNGVGVLDADFAYSRTAAPATGAGFSPDTGTATVKNGQTLDVLVTPTGGVGPYTIDLDGNQASWITIQDNGDGTATVSASPPLGTLDGLASFVVIVGNAGGSAIPAYSFTVALSPPTSISFDPDTATIDLVNGVLLQVACISDDPNASWALAGTPPSWANIDASAGIISIQPTIGTVAGLKSLQVVASNLDGPFQADYQFDTSLAPPTAPTFDPSPLSVQIGASSSSQASTSGDGPFVWSLDAAPAWASVDAAGLVTASPPGGTAAGAYLILASVEGASGAVDSVSSSLSVIVGTGAPTSIVFSPEAPSVAAGESMEVIAVGNGDEPQAYAIVSGQSWTSIIDTSGVMTLSPEAGVSPGSYTIRVSVENDASGGIPYEQDFVVVISDSLASDPVWDDDNIVNINAGVLFAKIPSHTGIIDTFAIVGGALPSGVVLDDVSGWIIGTAAVPGSFSVDLQGAGPGGTTGVVTVSIEVGEAPPSGLSYPTLSFDLPDGGTFDPGTPTYLGGSGGEAFSVSPAAPLGTEFSPEKGLWSGYPLFPFPETDFTVSLSDSVGRANGIPPAEVVIKITSTVTAPEGGGTGNPGLAPFLPNGKQSQRINRRAQTIIVDSDFFDRTMDADQDG